MLTPDGTLCIGTVASRMPMIDINDVEFYALALAVCEKLTTRALTGDLRAIKRFLELAGMYDIGIEARVRRLIDAGITPDIYKQIYLQITKSYPEP